MAEKSSEDVGGERFQTISSPPERYGYKQIKRKATSLRLLQ